MSGPRRLEQQPTDQENDSESMKLFQLSLRDLFWLVLLAALIVTINLPRHEGKVFRVAGFPFTFASWGLPPKWFNPVAFVGDAVLGGAVLTLFALALARIRQPSPTKPIPQPVSTKLFEPPQEMNERTSLWPQRREWREHRFKQSAMFWKVAGLILSLIAVLWSIWRWSQAAGP